MVQQINLQNGQYCGRILHGEYGDHLLNRLKELICVLTDFEKAGAPLISYISAWQDDERVIWYEFVGRNFCDLLNCGPGDVAEAFRGAIIERRVYRYADIEKKVEEEVLTKDELGGFWKGLREEGKQKGAVDAVYKVQTADDQSLWLKDQARVEIFEDDNICISLGFLTDVTKEMELKDLFEKIGYIDELTRLPNRSILERILEINIANLQRGNIDDFVLLMIDVDRFKAVNDTYGHQAGDYVLATLAEVMTNCTRKHDEIGRYGGEEFYGFTVGGKGLGIKFAERLRQNVERTRFVYKGHEIPITVSMGLAIASQVVKDDTLKAEQLIATADKRLYAAKESGRNKVVWE